MEKQALVRWAGRCAAVTFGLKNTFVDHEVRENSDPALGRPGIPGELAVDIAENEKCVVSCRHRLVLIPRQGKKGRNEIALLAIKKEGSAADNSDLWLAGVIQWLAERAAAQTDLGIRLVALNRGDGKDKKTGVSVSSMKSECLKPNDIHQWFKTLLRLMLVDRCCDHLPFGVVQALYKDTWETVTADTIIDNLESEYSGYPCYLEAFDLTDARIPDISDSELQTRARERFAPLLEGWLHE